ncbi:prenyltransferase/squalene oxidase repeat-containing protein [Ardenticatena maritima]|nr:prenyltransferase/squalene oxidase repeat-containing protein [Ardenticatena maritima]KPL88313.1 hypothetical protein SE16_05645 [Ardenticatena maritima]
MRQFKSVLMAFALVLVLALPTLAAADLQAAVAWLREQVQADGGVSDGFSEGSSVGATVDVVLAAAAVGEDVSTWATPSPLDFLATQASTAAGTGTLAKLTLAAVATGQDPTNFGGVDLVAGINAAYDAATGRFDGLVIDHAFAMLALKNAGVAIPDGAARALIDLQAEDGGWSFDGASQSDTNTTALAIQALVAADAGDAAIVKALGFLKTQQNEDGGFPYQKPSAYGTDTDANSTAWVIQALTATGDIAVPSPEEALAALQTESGAFQWQAAVPGENLLATAQAVFALAGYSYVQVPVVEAARPPAVPTLLAETGAPATTWLWLALVGVVLLSGGLVLKRA